MNIWEEFQMKEEEYRKAMDEMTEWLRGLEELDHENEPRLLRGPNLMKLFKDLRGSDGEGSESGRVHRVVGERRISRKVRD